MNSATSELKPRTLCGVVECEAAMLAMESSVVTQSMASVLAGGHCISQLNK